MSDLTNLQLEQITQYYKQADDIFHSYAVTKGLSDSGFWILYALCVESKPLTQNDLCEMYYLPKQTIHSSVAILVKNGYVTLAHAPGSRNSKHILLTPFGRAYITEHIQPIVDAEKRAFSNLTDDERRLYCEIAQKHLAFFRQEVKTLLSQ